MAITRSTGIPLGKPAIAVAGGGYQGITRELDETVARAAALLEQAYGRNVEIRFNSGRESGGAWLVTPDGGSADIGIGASLVTARARDSWERWARQYEAEAAGAGDLTDGQRGAAAKLAADWREDLALCPEGQLTICAHIDAAVVDSGLRPALAALPGWMNMARAGQGYHHGAAGSVEEALERCLRFAPAPGSRQEQHDG